MADLKSRVSYLQGLSAGLNLDGESREGKLLSGILEVLDEFAEQFNELEDAHEQLEDYLESIDEDLYQLENEILDIDEGAEDDDYLEADCPRCGETVCFSSNILEDDDVIEVTCPNCDEVVFVTDERFEAADEPELLESDFVNRRDDDI